MATITTPEHAKRALLLARDAWITNLNARPRDTVQGIPTEHPSLGELSKANPTDAEAAAFLTALEAALP